MKVRGTKEQKRSRVHSEKELTQQLSPTLIGQPTRKVKCIFPEANNVKIAQTAIGRPWRKVISLSFSGVSMRTSTRINCVNSCLSYEWLDKNQCFNAKETRKETSGNSVASLEYLRVDFCYFSYSLSISTIFFRKILKNCCRYFCEKDFKVE